MLGVGDTKCGIYKPKWGIYTPWVIRRGTLVHSLGSMNLSLMILSLLLMAFIFDIAEEYRLQEEYDRHSILDLLVHRLMMPHLHSYPCSDTAAYDSKKQQCRFGDAPPMFLGLQLVNTIYDEGKDVDNEQIYAELLHFF